MRVEDQGSFGSGNELAASSAAALRRGLPLTDLRVSSPNLDLPLSQARSRTRWASVRLEADAAVDDIEVILADDYELTFGPLKFSASPTSERCGLE